MLCLGCGAQLDVDTRFAHLVVCQYCSATMLLDKQAARVTGKMAVLPAPRSVLHVGATGGLRERRFRVLGRARYGYQAGYWDEWFLRFDDGRTGWISEDEGDLVLETLRELDEAPLPFESVRAGNRIGLEGESFHVDEKGIATLEGGEGQLPFAVEAGQQTPFLDLSAGEHQFGTLEYQPDGAARLFRGRRLDEAELQLDRGAEEAGGRGAEEAGGRGAEEAGGRKAAGSLSPERAGGAAGRQRIVRSAARAEFIGCYSCGAPLPPPAEGAAELTCPHCATKLDLTLRQIGCPSCKKTVAVAGGMKAKSLVCKHCDTQLDVSAAQPTALASLVRRKRPDVPLKLGQKATFNGRKFELVGHLRYAHIEAGVPYPWDEFLLHGLPGGYKWLVLENGHWSWCEELRARPRDIDPRDVQQRQTFEFLEKQWTVFERVENSVRLEWVDGELPWVAQAGDWSGYMDAIAPPEMVSAEWSRSGPSEEMEWFRSRYLDRAEVAAAFGLPEMRLPQPTGVAANQPIALRPFQRQSVWVMAAFCAAFVALAVMAGNKQARTAGNLRIRAQEYAQEVLTEPFTVRNAGSLCEATFSASVDNSWVYLEVALINARDEALLDFSAEIAYYHGVEGGESWSEGGRSDSVVFRVDEPGEYRLLVTGQSGKDELPAERGEFGKDVGIQIVEGVVLLRYYVVLAALCALWALIAGFERLAQEHKRWSAVEEDGDDD